MLKKEGAYTALTSTVHRAKDTDKDIGVVSVVQDAVKPAVVKSKDLTPIQRVVNAYKETKGVDLNDKDWDKANYSRYCKAAESLIKCLKTWERAATYVIGKGQ